VPQVSERPREDGQREHHHGAAEIGDPGRRRQVPERREVVEIRAVAVRVAEHGFGGDRNDGRRRTGEQQHGARDPAEERDERADQHEQPGTGVEPEPGEYPGRQHADGEPRRDGDELFAGHINQRQREQETEHGRDERGDAAGAPRARRHVFGWLGHGSPIDRGGFLRVTLAGETSFGTEQ